MNNEMLSPTQAVEQLTPAVWNRVNTLLTAKALSEFAHELLIQPKLERTEGAWGHYLLEIESAETAYRFRAQVLSLDHWYLDKASIQKTVRGLDAPLDAMSLIVELRVLLKIPAQVLPAYLEEIASTLYGSAYKHAREGLSAQALTSAGFQEVETSMMEGHPIFVANNGRIGFTASDYRKFAPEAAAPQPLVWVAASKKGGDFACVKDLTYAELLRDELGTETLERFNQILLKRGLDPSAYLFLPVHPWQWQNKVAQLFASDLAKGALVYLGRGEALYQAQQSIRTLFNLSQPGKRYVKTALSILNMGFTRGLSSVMASKWAAVNDWVQDLVQQDAYLQRNGFRLLREVAFMGYRHGTYERAIEKRYDGHKEMLAALWRENPTRLVEPGQRLMTMAALMHLDRDGASVLSALIRSSNVSIDTWLRRYLSCYFTPLLHCFYTHNLVFTPHCENIILVLENNVPVSTIMKDISDDIGVLNPETPLPADVKHLALPVPEEVITLSIFTDVFDCVLRFLAQILYEHDGYPEEKFWRLVAECIRDYERSQPQLEAKFRRYDLFAPRFTRNCLNRLQLADNRQMVDLNAVDPVSSLQFVGALQNPIASFGGAPHGTP